MIDFDYFQVVLFALTSSFAWVLMLRFAKWSNRRIKKDTQHYGL